MTTTQYPHQLSVTFGAGAGAVAARYPLDRYGGSASLAYSAAVTDGVFACVADRIGESLAAHAPVYGYEFNDRTAHAGSLAHVAFSRRRQSFSGVALPVRHRRRAPLDPAQKVLSDQMIDYWSAFVAKGAPKSAGQPGWPAKSATPTKPVVAAARRSQGDNRLRRGASVRFLGELREGRAHT